eukprot:TRINITY_DN82898_c0_g1_i1.p1 TRINITY_DN82898_c0_g1~~TRINITY_DN82898_c0_g1_i1.p1  ORF type:complete len:398 (-),score=96.89 TRINITY_DN82898_c0_g1_i1:183-1376(-)
MESSDEEDDVEYFGADGRIAARFERWLGSVVERAHFYGLEFCQNGGHSVVYHCCDCYTNSKVVIKAIPLSRPYEREETIIRRKGEVRHEMRLLSRFGYESFEGRRRSSKQLKLEEEEGEGGGGGEVEDKELRYYGEYPVSCSMTSGGFCCFGYVGNGSDVCSRCQQRLENHRPGTYDVCVMAIDYRGEELYAYLQRIRKNPLTRMRYEVAYAIVLAIVSHLMELWSMGYAHRDIKTENIAVDSTLTFLDIVAGKNMAAISLIDFGSVRSIEWERRQREPKMDEVSPSGRTYGVMPSRRDFVDSSDVDLLGVDILCVGALIRDILHRSDLREPDAFALDLLSLDELASMELRSDFKIQRILSVVDARERSSEEKKNMLSEIVIGLTTLQPVYGEVPAP